MKTPLVRSPRRLLMNVLALALALGALATAPAPTNANVGWTCERGCIDWNIEQGCIGYSTCCVNDRGGWLCTGG